MKENQDLNIIQFTQDLRVPATISKEEAWQRLEKNISNLSEKPNTQTRFPIYTFISLSIAASILLFIFYFALKQAPTKTFFFETQSSEVKKEILPDSSIIFLNANSTATFTYNKFRKKREVSLSGDAFFNVRKGKEFSVLFGGGQVNVLGTAFYVSAYSDRFISIECTEGKVRFEIDNQKVTLNAGEGIKSFDHILSEKFTVNEKDVKEKLNGVFFWQKISLAEIEELIENRLGYNVILETTLATRNFSGELLLTSPQSFLPTLAAAMNLDYTINDKEKTITLNAK
ncbi:MAG: FecR domain-containing protein [Bacteroidales bacterium]|nr:FecR domain-containing protein [Bacteroidales bacterium]